MILPNCIFTTINSTLQNPNHFGGAASRGSTYFTGVFTNNLGQTMLFDICSGWELCIKYRILFVVLGRSKFQHKIRCVIVWISCRWFRCSKKREIVFKLNRAYNRLIVQCSFYFTIAKSISICNILFILIMLIRWDIVKFENGFFDIRLLISVVS